MVIHILKQIGGDTIPKHKPPSRIRYEKSHPTVSFRLTRELKERLEKVLEEKSFADFVKEGLGVREREKASIKEAYGDGYDDGFERAKRMFGIYTKCAICGDPIAVDDDETKKELANYMKSLVYYHIKCKESEDRHRR